MGRRQVTGRPVPASLILSAYLALFAAAAAAEEPPVASEEIEVRIDTVVASNAPKASFDPALASLQQPFGRMFTYSSYRFVQGEQRRVNFRREAEFLLPGGRNLVIVARGYKDDRVLLNVMLLAGPRPLVNTALALKNHGVFLLAGPRFEEGTLIIAIGASTTPQTQHVAARTP
jgi:hypothetical protein